MLRSLAPIALFALALAAAPACGGDGGGDDGSGDGIGDGGNDGGNDGGDGGDDGGDSGGDGGGDDGGDGNTGGDDGTTGADDGNTGDGGTGGDGGTTTEPPPEDTWGPGRCSSEEKNWMCAEGAGQCHFEPSQINCFNACGYVKQICEANPDCKACSGQTTDEMLCQPGCENTRNFNCANLIMGCFQQGGSCDSINSCIEGGL